MSKLMLLANDDESPSLQHDTNGYNFTCQVVEVSTNGILKKVECIGYKAYLCIRKSRYEKSNRPMNIVILCNGDFPSAPQPLKALYDADHIICCDGAYNALMRLVPDISTPLTVIGDMDSIVEREGVETIRISEQDTNDQTKAFRHVRSQWPDAAITILGATGKREDHTLGNISLLADYLEGCGGQLSIRMVTDYGVFTPINVETSFPSFPRQQVSLFAITPGCLITTEGLQYPLRRQPLPRLWQGTLNAALDYQFSVHPHNGIVIVYQTHDPKQ